jgi:hypothetical protein
VPHTVEEAYELADAANSGNDAKLLDELGDVLFQVHFLSLLLEERGAGDLGAVAEHCRQKLIRRHPHVFGDVETLSAGAVLRNWDAIKATRRRAASRGSSATSRRTCPHCCTRASCSGAPLRPGCSPARPPPPSTPRRPPPILVRPSTRSASGCSPSSTRRAGCASTPSLPCAPPRSASSDRLDARARDSHQGDP